MIIQLAGAVLASVLGTAPGFAPRETPVPPAAPAYSEPLADGPLAEIWGGAEPAPTPAAASVLSSTNTGNTINAAGSVASGPIDFSGAALQNFAGIGNFVFNTGNNNNLEGSITVNVTMAP